MSLIGPKYSSSKFTWEGNHGSAEVSDFKTLYDSGSFFDRLYDDACDEGFVIVSTKTGLHLPMTLQCVVRSDEQELQSWEFVNSLHGITVSVYND